MGIVRHPLTGQGFAICRPAPEPPKKTEPKKPVENWADTIALDMLSQGDDRKLEVSIAEALRAERERAAQICQDFGENIEDESARVAALTLAAAIRKG